MTDELNMSANNLVAMPRSSLALLRGTLLREGGPAAASFLQESGYAGGETVSAGFARWLEAHGYAQMSELDMDTFAHCVSQYFESLGWGTLSIEGLTDGVAALDSTQWWEAAPESQLDHPGCHISTGLFADLLGRVSGEPLAVLEVECRSMGSQRCRFLIGSAEALERVYERIVGGSSYSDALGNLSD